MPTNKVLLVDGTNTFHRNFVVNPTSDTNGNPIGGLLGTIRSLKWMIKEVRAEKVVFVWDGPGGSQRRRGVIAEYKAGRKPRANREVEEGVKDSRENYQWQKEKLNTLLPFLGVTLLEVENIEADDCIGYLVGCLDPKPKVILSSDRDMWQLVSDTTAVYWPTRKVFITKETYKDQVPCLPENYVLFRALSGKGDASDNIHGIKGLGEKTILKLFPEFLTRPLNHTELLLLCYERLGDGKGPKRWYKAIQESTELVSRNVTVMQLSVPDISPQAGNIIRQAAEAKPSFNMTGFKLALINNDIQITDQDLFPVFQEYRARVANMVG